MSVDLLVNLALADVTPHPLVLPVERANLVTPDRLLAIWCERERGYQTLYERIVVSRERARQLKRPLAIWTDDDYFDVSVTGVIQFHDQWWMRCSREPDESLTDLRERYTQAIMFCPLGTIVLVVGFDPPDVPEDDRVEHLQLCLELARALTEVKGLVWIGTVTAESPALVEALKGVPGPPPVADIDAVEWGKGGEGFQP